LNILPAASGEDSYGLSVCFPEMASVGSSHSRPTSAEDHEEALRPTWQGGTVRDDGSWASL